MLKKYCDFCNKEMPVKREIQSCQAAIDIRIHGHQFRLTVQTITPTDVCNKCMAAILRTLSVKYENGFWVDGGCKGDCELVAVKYNKGENVCFQEAEHADNDLQE